MTDETLDAIEMRANAAAPGPWIVGEDGGGGCPGHMIGCEDDPYIELPYATHVGALNAAFIAAAREDVPALVAEVRRLRADFATLRRAAARVEYEHALDDDGGDELRDVLARLRAP